MLQIVVKLHKLQHAFFPFFEFESKAIYNIFLDSLMDHFHFSALVKSISMGWFFGREVILTIQSKSTF